MWSQKLGSKIRRHNGALKLRGWAEYHPCENVTYAYKGGARGASFALTPPGTSHLRSLFFLWFNFRSFFDNRRSNITFNGPVLAIASAALPNYEFFSKLLSDEKVTSISLGKAARPEIHLDVKDHKLFELPSEISEERHELNCEIFEFDKYEGAGSLSVFDEQSVTKGEYRFDVIGQQNMNDYIEAILRRHVKVVCLEEVVDHPIVGRKIISLKVVNVKPA